MPLLKSYFRTEKEKSAFPEHIVIDFGSVKAGHSDRSIVQRGYQVAADITHIAGILFQRCKDVFDMAAVELKEPAFHYIMRLFLAVRPDSLFLRTYHIDHYGYQLVDFVSLFRELLDQDIIVSIIPDDLGIASPFFLKLFKIHPINHIGSRNAAFFGFLARARDRWIDYIRIIELYHNHAVCEQFHSEIKTDMGIERLPSGKFETNALILKLAMIAYNVLRIIGTEAMKKQDMPVRHDSINRRRIRTIIDNLILIADHLTVHACKLRLALGRSNVWITTFLRLDAAF